MEDWQKLHYKNQLEDARELQKDYGCDVYFRFSDEYSSGGSPAPYLHTFVAVKETDKGVWLMESWGRFPREDEIEEAINGINKYFVLKEGGKKRFAHKSIQGAAHYYKRRKECHVRFARNNLHRAELFLDVCDELQEIFKE